MPISPGILINDEGTLQGKVKTLDFVGAGVAATVSGATATVSIAGASGITSLNALTGASQTFANDTNVTITSSGTTHTLGWAGTLAVARGGLGLSSGTSGGILGFTATGTLASSAALTANAIVLGGGVSATPTVLGSLGTTTTVLHGNAAGAPTWGAVLLTADVTGTLPAANGGTASTYFTVAGPTAARTYTFPDAAVTIASLTSTQTFTGKTHTNPANTSQTLTDGATVSWDTDSGGVATVTLAGNRVMAAPTNLKTGTYILVVIQDATGSRTLTWNAVFKWAGGSAPTLSTGANAKDILSFFCDGTNLYGSILKAFA